MLSTLKNKNLFRKKNKRAWVSSWLYWYKKEYVHQGIKESLHIELRKLKKEKAKLRVLDLGCGSAWVAKYFGRYFTEYTGIDFNQSLIEKLDTQYKRKNNFHFWNYDLESSISFLFDCKNYELIIGNFILLELSDLSVFFKKAASLQKKGNYLFLTGLDPLNEIYRDSDTLKEVDKNISIYRHSKVPILLTKTMSFNGDNTSFNYYRILYSINDITSVSTKYGYEIYEVNDKLNRSADSTTAPLYYSIKLRKK